MYGLLFDSENHFLPEENNNLSRISYAFVLPCFSNEGSQTQWNGRTTDGMDSFAAFAWRWKEFVGGGFGNSHKGD